MFEEQRHKEAYINPSQFSSIAMLEELGESKKDTT